MITNVEEKLTASDEQYGYRYGCEGIISIQGAAKFIGVHENTIRRLCNDGFLRKGKRPYGTENKEKLKRVVVCRRSLREYVESTEE